jgi:hypothetical protein
MQPRAGRLKFEVQPIVESAPGVERCSAGGASCVAGQIFPDRHFAAARAAQNCRLPEIGLRPLLGGMSSGFLMAIKTGIVYPAASELDRDDIDRGSIMDTACSRIQSAAIHGNFSRRALHSVVRELRYRRRQRGEPIISMVGWLNLKTLWTC